MKRSAQPRPAGIESANWWPAPTLKEMTEAERSHRRDRLVDIALAVEEGWARKAAGLPDPPAKTRAAGAE